MTDVAKEFIAGGGRFCVVRGDVVESPLGLPHDLPQPACYEVFRVVQGRARFLASHLERLEASAVLAAPENSTARLPPRLETLLETLIQRNEIIDQNVKVVVSPDGALCFAYPVASFYPPESYYNEGIKVRVISHVRGEPNAKVLNVSLKERLGAAMAEGSGNDAVFELLLKGENGDITEGSRSNVFCIVGGALVTPPADTVLKGITRTRVCAAAVRKDIELKETTISERALAASDAVFITSTSNGILPVRSAELEDGTEVKFDVKNETLLALINEFARE